ncbi:PAS domain-containing protein [Streptomyces noursei]|uniref:PAS domain-containing protein n=1 Tax=Streptomyces noursei TaxID=1971 RepID=UPI00167408E9|nr:PAS domain-containing protein [Streptomyces noursei]GGX14836.1 diguanylate cyclase [Streptomyces noursei]
MDGPGQAASGTPRTGADTEPDRPPDADDSGLLAALLDGMDAALMAFAADGTVTHWNHEAARILGWTPQEAVGRPGLTGWAVRAEDAEGVQSALAAAMRAPGRQVHDFALLTKDGHRVLVRTQSSAVHAADGRVAGVYCAFSESHTQLDLERAVALSEALFEDATWGVVLIDADLRPAVVNGHAARAFGRGRTALLGRPLGDVLAQGVEELENAFQHVLAEGAPPAIAELWVTLRDGECELPRRCWRSGFVRLASPLAEEPVPLGVAWLFQDVTELKRTEQDGSLLRFRAHQLHRAGRAAAECPDPAEAAAVHLDFALAGFADHALVDLARAPAPAPYGAVDADAAWDVDPLAPDGGPGAPVRAPRLVRALASPAGAPGPSEAVPAAGIPVAYAAGHPALQAYARRGSVRASAGQDPAEGWAAARNWPDGTVHGLCVVLRSRGRTLGVATFLRMPARRPFDRADADYAEEVAARVAAALDLAGAAGV